MATLPDVANLRVALIGFGEVGAILGRALRARGVASVRAYDLLLDDRARGAKLGEGIRAEGIAPASSAADAARSADLVICAVTASQAIAAANAAAPGLHDGSLYVDVNSASPGAKQECAAIVHAAGGRYVEMAVMTAIPPKGIATPMLSGGPHAADAAPLLAALGFRAEVASERFGVASAIKMCRSVIVKGMEAIVIESFVTARKYGVEDEVLASLAETFPGLDWEKSGGYFFQRVVQHGRRRAEELREAAVTVQEAGLEPFLASAIAARQAWVADLKETGGLRESSLPWREQADAMIARGRT
jgi:3-hydroxyisobutyrate dehydrogenase-like beta-hydroxyacid dehydrogenase